MKSSTMFLMTVLCAIVGSCVGTYISFTLYKMYGFWSFLMDAIIIIVVLYIIYYVVYYMMNRPVKELSDDIEEPEDVYEE